jgi:photoactive yellow protein
LNAPRDDASTQDAPATHPSPPRRRGVPREGPAEFAPDLIPTLPPPRPKTASAALEGPGAVDPFALDELDDAALDALPAGVIGLDPEGWILRYNLAEARLARLDRNAVVGRHFFDQVAPCTRTDRFEGRFRRFVERSAPGDQRLERFAYLFDFAHGAQEVEITLVRPAAPARFYILVERRGFAAPRTGLPDAFVAPSLERWVGEEAQAGLGVVRDADAQRAVTVSAGFFTGLLAACRDVAPDAWRVLCDHWGVRWGRIAAVDLEVEALQRDGIRLRELPMRVVAERISEKLSREGWGRARFDFRRAGEGALLVTLDRNALAEATGPSTSLRSDVLAGWLAAVTSAVADRRLGAREIDCDENGRSVFLLTGRGRLDEVDALLDAGRRGEALVDQLGRGASR